MWVCFQNTGDSKCHENIQKVRPDEKPLAETHEVCGKWTPKKTKSVKDNSEKQNVTKAREDITKVP